MVLCQLPPNVKAELIGNRPVLTTQQGGKIAIDAQLLALWEFADAKSLGMITEEFKPGRFPPEEIIASLACLAEAGLL